MKRGSNAWLRRLLALALVVVLAGCVGIPGLPMRELQSWLESAEGQEILAELEQAGLDIDVGNLENLAPEILDALWNAQGYASILLSSLNDDWPGDRQLVPAGG